MYDYIKNMLLTAVKTLVLSALLIICGFLVQDVVITKPATETQIVRLKIDDKERAIRDKIQWNTDFSYELEEATVNEMLSLPDNVLTGWLSIDSKIVIEPPIKGSLDNHNVYTYNDGGYTAAYNAVTVSGGTVKISEIHVLGDAETITESLHHEVGHYVYYEDFAHSTTNPLPYFDSEKELFISNELDCHDYYYSDKEYFAAMFAYVVDNGVTDVYPDTQVMQDIINVFY